MTTTSAAKVARTPTPSNAEIVRRGYGAFNTADMDLLTKLFDEKATWHTPGKSPTAGSRKGRNEVFAQFGRYGGETGGTFKATLIDVMESEDGAVVGYHHNTGMRNGKKLDVMCCILFELKDGRVVSGKEHFFDLYAWDQFWS